MSEKSPDFDVVVDHYKILKIPKNATESEIKRAYYKLAQQYNPAKNGGRT